MFPRVISSALASLAVAGLFGPPMEALAADSDQQLFQTVEGSWSGPGEIVAGKYKGTRFTCTFKGTTPSGKVGMALDGGCRVGPFTQKMSATFERGGRGYRGAFMDGAAGKGLDITSGNVEGRRVVFGLNRHQLNGAMLANFTDDNTLRVTISVRVDEKLVPVIGANLKRTEGPAAVAQQ